MLPHVQLQNGDQCNGDVALLVVKLLDDEALANGVPCEDCPAGALNGQCNVGEVLTELVEGAEELVDCRCQLAGGLVAALGGQVVPEDGVVGVATQVERQVLGELGDVAVCTVAFTLLFMSWGASHLCKTSLEPVDFRRRLFPTAVDNPVYQQDFQGRHPILP